MPIIFIDSNAVQVDGQNAGDIVSVLSNYPTRKAEILKAFQDFRKGEKEAKVAAKETELAALKAEHAAKLADEESKRLARETEIAAKLAEKDTKLFEAEQAKQAAKQALKDTFDLLGGDPNIKALKKQAAIEEADRQLAEAIRRKEELSKPEPEPEPLLVP